MLGRLFSHFSNYSVGSLFVSMAGLVSFPILTRLLSVDEYGLLALIGSTLGLLTAVGKLGLQHSALRFYSDLRKKNAQWTLDTFFSTIVLGMGAIGLVTTATWLVIVQFVPVSWWNDDRLTFLLSLTSIIVLIRILDSAFVNILRAQERSRIYSAFQVAKRYVELVVIIGALLYISRSLTAFYSASIAVEIVAMLVLGFVVLKGVNLAPRHFSMALLRSMMLYGIPMIGYELAGILLGFGDRYVIQWFLGAEKLGAYAASYNLTDYVNTIVILSVSQAIMPMYLRIWSEQGADATRAFLNRAFRYYFMLTLPVVAGLSAVGPDLLTFLASEKYYEGARIMPFVITGFVLDGMVIFLGAGIFIQKRSTIMMKLVALAAMFNIAMNIILVPRMGITGAAVATVASYGLLALLTKLSADRYLSVSIPVVAILKYSTLSGLMYLVVANIYVASEWLSLIVKIGLGIVIYILALVATDRGAREDIGKLIQKLRADGASNYD